MFSFIKKGIDGDILRKLELPVLWNTALKGYKRELQTEKPVVLVQNNLPGDFDREIISGLAKSIGFRAREGNSWITNEDEFLSMLAKAINEKQVHIAFCSNELLDFLKEKVYFSESCDIFRPKFNNNDLEEILRHFNLDFSILDAQTFSFGEFFIAFLLIAAAKKDCRSIVRISKNMQFQKIGNDLVLVPKIELLTELLFDHQIDIISSIFGIDPLLIGYFSFYESILKTFPNMNLPPFSRNTFVNMLVSKIIAESTLEQLSLERLGKMAKFYETEYFEELSRIVKAMERPNSGYSYSSGSVKRELWQLMEEKYKLICYTFHGLEYDYCPKQQFQKEIAAGSDFLKSQKLALFDPNLVKFVSLELDNQILNTVAEIEIKHIRETGIKLDDTLFKAHNTRLTNTTKLVALVANVVYFCLFENICKRNMVSAVTKERVLTFLSKIEPQFFSLDDRILRNLQSNLGVTDITNLSTSIIFDIFLKKSVSNLSQIIEGTSILDEMVDLNHEDLLTRFLTIYERSVKELGEADEPDNIRKWIVISFFYDVVTEYLINAYHKKINKNQINVLREIIDYSKKFGFDHTILVVIDGLSYVHWELVKDDLFDKVKDIAKLRLDDFRLGPILSRTPVGHSQLFSGLLSMENGVYSDRILFDDSQVDLMQSKFIGPELNPGFIRSTRITKAKIAQGIFRSKYGKSGLFYFFTSDLGSPMTLLFENFLGTSAVAPQTKLAKKNETAEEVKFSEDEIKKFASFVYQLKEKNLSGKISIVQYPDIDRVMHYSGWNFKFYLDVVETQIKNLIETISKAKIEKKILLVVTSDHGSISKAESKLITDLAPFDKFTMDDFNNLAQKIPRFDPETNRFSFSYFQFFDDSQIAATQSLIGYDNKALKTISNEDLYDKMGKYEGKGLKTPRGFVLPKYLMHFTQDSVLRHGNCSLSELLIPFALIEVKS